MKPNLPEKERLRQNLIRLSAGLSALAGSLPEGDRGKCESAVSRIVRSIVPQLAEDFPLLVAVTGGGSAGKSTVFNALAGKKASATDPRAGFTRRMVAAVNPALAADARKMNLLFERFRANARPRRMEDAGEVLRPGDPVYVECPDVPENLVFVDTPDFDTGTREGFTNREAAREILEVADVLVHVATNATYNNKSATDFVRSALSEIGIRKAALLYRLSPAYGDDVAREHMDAALSNLYPDGRTAADACIGVWRMDESNDVAAGLRDPEIRPLDGGVPLVEALASLDPAGTRKDALRTEIAGILGCAGDWIRAAGVEALKFEAYRDSLRFLTSDACRRCLGVAPQRDVIRLFAEEWEAAQPWAVRHGHWLSRRVAGLFRKKKAADGSPGFREAFRANFIEAARDLQKAAEPPGVRFSFPKSGAGLQRLAEAIGALAAAHPDGYSIRDPDPGNEGGRREATVSRPRLPPDAVREKPPSGEALSRMADLAEAAMGETESLRPEIRALVRRTRDGMTFRQSAGEWFSASLDTIALAGTLTYVAATGDVFTGGTLLSMFGFNDLVAIPALGAFLAAKGGIGGKAAERQMSALFTAWANGKAGAIRGILEDGITGGDVAACDERCKRLSGTLGNMEEALAGARANAARVFGTGTRG